MQRSRALMLIVAALFAGQPLCAAPSAEMRVSVQVIARTILTIDSQPASIDITAADVARGYVDLPSSVTFHVRSNARNGYTVQFEPVASPFSRADLSWGTTAVAVGGEASWAIQPYQQGSSFGTMSVRLSLAPDTAPGTYAWPVVFGANSL